MTTSTINKWNGLMAPTAFLPFSEFQGARIDPAEAARSFPLPLYGIRFSPRGKRRWGFTTPLPDPLIRWIREVQCASEWEMKSRKRSTRKSRSKIP